MKAMLKSSLLFIECGTFTVVKMWFKIKKLFLKFGTEKVIPFIIIIIIIII